jgi:hypothetical protein
MGVLSNGMLLAAVDGSQTTLISPERSMKPGTRLR